MPIAAFVKQVYVLPFFLPSLLSVQFWMRKMFEKKLFEKTKCNSQK